MYGLDVILNALSGKYVEKKYNFLPSEPLVFILRVTAENNNFFYYIKTYTFSEVAWRKHPSLNSGFKILVLMLYDKFSVPVFC